VFSTLSAKTCFGPGAKTCVFGTSGKNMFWARRKNTCFRYLRQKHVLGPVRQRMFLTRSVTTSVCPSATAREEGVAPRAASLISMLSLCLDLPGPALSPAVPPSPLYGFLPQPSRRYIEAMKRKHWFRDLYPIPSRRLGCCWATSCGPLIISQFRLQPAGEVVGREHRRLLPRPLAEHRPLAGEDLQRLRGQDCAREPFQLQVTSHGGGGGVYGPPADNHHISRGFKNIS